MSFSEGGARLQFRRESRLSQCRLPGQNKSHTGDSETRVCGGENVECGDTHHQESVDVYFLTERGEVEDFSASVSQASMVDGGVFRK